MNSKSIGIVALAALLCLAMLAAPLSYAETSYEIGERGCWGAGSLLCACLDPDIVQCSIVWYELFWDIFMLISFFGYSFSRTLCNLEMPIIGGAPLEGCWEPVVQISQLISILCIGCCMIPIFGWFCCTIPWVVFISATSFCCPFYYASVEIYKPAIFCLPNALANMDEGCIDICCQ